MTGIGTTAVIHGRHFERRRADGCDSPAPCGEGQGVGVAKPAVARDLRRLHLLERGADAGELRQACGAVSGGDGTLESPPPPLPLPPGGGNRRQPLLTDATAFAKHPAGRADPRSVTFKDPMLGHRRPL